MNDTPNTINVDTVDNVAQRPYYLDAEGNRVEIPFDIDGSDGEATQSETAFIAEDLAAHPVTVH